ncbi:TonB-dependent hemoglobin/transferrin/lactoferrin family receptor [Pseudomonas sp. ABC1]|uniref:TonB-dependent receptor n=1 Tax=Pseudomonas sp. ABC1 TaxID=2748080 RepID=UPI0015C35401|nr:TonB-dependent receptor [Pseudomonas sp. ABC1]QLF93551.1 TonB-dependent hemoglobin/transferrin/lactoferrin family receptor [Pseudomonas sp. ABC1]
MASAYAAEPAAQYSFAIAAQPLTQALNAFVHVTGQELAYPAALANDRVSSAVEGDMPAWQALQTLLQGTGLVFRQDNARQVITLEPASVESSSALQLDATTVHGIGNGLEAGQWVYGQPRSVSEIDRKQLDDRPARHAADMLEQTAGVYSSVSQQDPALSVNIRGIQDYGRVNMNIDGMRQNFQKSGHGQRNGQMYIDPELISSVVIDKGPSSAMGGAGAIGGIATFGTLTADEFLEPGKEIGGKLKLGGGDNGTHFIGSGAFAVGNEIGDILLAASERHMGDYWPGNLGNIGDIRTAVGTPENTAQAQKNLKNSQVTDSGYTMRSHLLKAGINLPQQQRVQFSYLSTSTKSPNPSMITQVGDITELGWKSSGFSDTDSSSLALDYSLSPEDSAWLDLKAKLYYVDTDDDSDTYRTSASVDNSYQTQTRVRTYGFQLQNHSYLQLTPQRQLDVDYGLEFFYDKATSDSSRTQVVNVTPGGNRSMASLFSRLSYEHDGWLTLEGGLRYDRYRLRGDTGMEIVTFPYTQENPCVARRLTGCPTVRAWTPWDVDAKEGRFSPTFALAVKPGVEWLQLFTSYGKSWRPPALTETLTTGSAHSSSTQYPNPWLDSEHSRSWETGVNVQFDGLLTNNDRLGAKLAWFDTRVDNYINLEIDRVKPGVFTASSGNAAYVNNLLAMRFRGLEFQLDYDAERIYGALSYTRMVGSNSSCSMPAWMGGVIVRESEPNASGTNNYYAGNSEWNGFVRCDYNTLFGSAAYLPGDRGSLTLGSRWFDQRLDAGLIVRYNRGHQDDSTVNSSGGNGDFYVADWPEYTLVDLYASYRLSSQLKLSASVENVGNRAYIVNYGDSVSYTLGRGRTVQGALEYRF